MYHHLTVESRSASALYGRYVPLPRWWAEWEVPPGVWAVLPAMFAYIGSAVINNPDSACWEINDSLLLVWDVYGTGSIWNISTRLRQEIWALPVATMSILLGPLDYDVKETP